jgi:hypothetical protein
MAGDPSTGSEPVEHPSKMSTEMPLNSMVAPGTPALAQVAIRLLRTNDYAARWLLIAGCAIVAALWMRVLGIGLDVASLGPKLSVGVLLIAVALLLQRIGSQFRLFGRPVAVAVDLLLSLVQLLAMLTVFLPLTYLAATVGFPLLDDRLAALDAALFGVHWQAASAWVQAHPLLDAVLTWAYGSIFWQGAAVLVLGSVARPGERNGEALWLFAVSLTITIAVFCFTPALGQLGHVGAEPMSALQALRAGQVRVFNFANSEGIITFPSFHTALALIVTYCVRRQRLALAVIAPINIAMLASIPTVGGHYVVDMLGGATVTLISILMVRRLRGERPLFIARQRPSAARTHPVGAD